MSRYAIIPCSGRKLERRAPARELYTGSLFRSALLAATALERAGFVAGVRVLSAAHGLVQLETELDPYDLRMGDPATISALELGRQIDELAGDPDVELLPLLPAAYATALELGRRSAELECFTLPNPLRGSRGVLEMRGRLRQLREDAHQLGGVPA